MHEAIQYSEYYLYGDRGLSFHPIQYILVRIRWFWVEVTLNEVEYLFLTSCTAAGRFSFT